MVTCASVSGGFCGAGSGGLVCAAACIDPAAMSTISIRNVISASESEYDDDPTHASAVLM
jgi:hypothetical protein